ncbi:hypothetical protein BEK67_19715 [Ralstonia pickettii]|nr:hypothetical protein BEK67_19715 [Ralstonia pickettii]
MRPVTGSLGGPGNGIETKDRPAWRGSLVFRKDFRAQADTAAPKEFNRLRRRALNDVRNGIDKRVYVKIEREPLVKRQQERVTRSRIRENDREPLVYDDIRFRKDL